MTGKIVGRKVRPYTAKTAKQRPVSKPLPLGKDLISQAQAANDEIYGILKDQHLGGETPNDTLKRIIAERDAAKLENQRIWENAKVEELPGVPLVILDQIITMNSEVVQTPLFVNAHSYEVRREPKRGLGDPYPDRVTLRHIGPQQQEE